MVKVTSSIKWVGVQSYNNGNKYEGNWIANERSGIGTLFYANRDKYHGSWLNDKRHGKGNK